MAVLTAISFWAGGLISSAAEPPTDWLANLTQLGIGALVAAPSWLAALTLWRRNLQLDSEIAELQEARRVDLSAQIERERELSSRIVPTLAEAARVIADAPNVYRETASEWERSRDLRDALDQLAPLVRDLKARPPEQ